MAKNILLIQCYNANKGDNSVAKTMIDCFVRDGYEVSVTAFDAERAGKEYGVQAGEYLFSAWRARLAPGKFSMLVELLKECLWVMYSFLFLLAFRFGYELPMIARKRTTIRNYINADIVVFPGGHFFTSYNSLLNNLSHYYAMRFAQVIGKKTMAYAQTVGPFEGLAGRVERFLSNRVLRHCERVTLREKYSLGEYNAENCEVTAETVFMNNIPIQSCIKAEKYIDLEDIDLVVGVTIHHLYYKHFFTRNEYVRRMANIFNDLLARYNCAILIIPMENRSFDDGDRTIAKEMINMVGNKERIKVVDDDLTPMETACFIADLDVLIGTKTHSVVYGLTVAVPTLSISYQRKSTEFMRMFGMEQYAIAMEDLDSVLVGRIMADLIDNRKRIKTLLESRIGDVRKMAERNNKILYKLLG